jgi:hypothetical protein
VLRLCERAGLVKMLWGLAAADWLS